MFDMKVSQQPADIVAISAKILDVEHIPNMRML
jgi:hypothetical protein